MMLGMTERKLVDAEDVLVLRPSGEWVHGVVYDYAERDGVWKYFVQLSGFASASAEDPGTSISSCDTRIAHEQGVSKLLNY
jgi:hypothetical protein